MQSVIGSASERTAERNQHIAMLSQYNILRVSGNSGELIYMDVQSVCVCVWRDCGGEWRAFRA